MTHIIRETIIQLHNNEITSEQAVSIISSNHHVPGIQNDIAQGFEGSFLTAHNFAILMKAVATAKSIDRVDKARKGEPHSYHDDTEQTVDAHDICWEYYLGWLDHDQLKDILVHWDYVPYPEDHSDYDEPIPGTMDDLFSAVTEGKISGKICVEIIQSITYRQQRECDQITMI